ncbi:MAG TPA: EthD domain-containing protein [Acidimicrobiales bacterium]
MPVEDHRAIALLKGGEGLEQRAREIVRGWPVPPEGRVRCLRRDDGTPFAGTHFEELCPDLEPWDVALDVWAPDPATAAAPLRGLRDRLGDTVDADHSQVLAGPQWRARKPPTAYGLTFCVTRKADLDHRGFVDYWRHNHAMIPLPMLRTFCQFYVDADRSAELAASAGLPAGTYDGISEPTYSDADHFRELTLDERVRVGARADEFNFIDHTRSAAALFRTVEERS